MKLSESKAENIANYLFEHWNPDQAEFIAKRIAPAMNGATLDQMKEMAQKIALFNKWPNNYDGITFGEIK